MIRFRRTRLKLRILLCRMTSQPRDVLLRHEFNLWAEEERGETMEAPHKLIAERSFEKMKIADGDRIMDLGCGGGWASRMMARLVGETGLVVGVDVSDGMVRRAQARNREFKNLRFACGSAERIPWQDNFFTKILSIEAIYYVENQDRALREMLRVTAPGGRLHIAICLYTDHADSISHADEVNVPVHVRSAAEYTELMRNAGWSDVTAEEFIRKQEPGRKPNVHDRTLFLSARKAPL